MDEYEGWVPIPDVLIDKPRESLVLDQHGKPYYLEVKKKIGFDLRRRNAGNTC